MRLIVLLASGWLFACGSVSAGADAPMAPEDSSIDSKVLQMITVSGTAVKRSISTITPAVGATVDAFRADDTVPLVSTTTDAQGKYSLAVATDGAFDGYVKSALSSYLDTYLYPPAPLTASFSALSINHIDSSTLNYLSNTSCGSAQLTTNGIVAVVVVDANNMPVAGVAVSSAPAATKYCYNGTSGLPDMAATMTATDGVAYMINVPAGKVTVSAQKVGIVFRPHDVTARANVLTGTLIQP
jgi:hypothetical protein